MLEQYRQHLLDTAELFAVAGDIAEDLLLGRRVRRLAELDIDQPDLAADRVEHPGPRVDRLGDVTGKRQSEDGHRVLLQGLLCFAVARPARGAPRRYPSAMTRLTHSGTVSTSGPWTRSAKSAEFWVGAAANSSVRAPARPVAARNERAGSPPPALPIETNSLQVASAA